MDGYEADLVALAVDPKMADALAPFQDPGRAGGRVPAADPVVQESGKDRTIADVNHPSQWLGDGAWGEQDSGKWTRLREIAEVVAAKRKKCWFSRNFAR